MSESERLNDIVRPLMPRVRAGDRGAIDRLVRACHQRVYRWALSKTADADDADEVTQMVLIRLSRTVASYRGESGFSTWLYRLTGNAVIDLHRGRTRRERLSERARARVTVEREHVRDMTQARLDHIHTTQVAGLVRMLFDELPAQQREIFDLIDLQGHTPAEVSRMKAMNGATVRAHLLKARRAIRRRIVMEIPALQEEVVE